MVDRCERVFAGIFRIVEQGHVVLVDQVLELFFQITYRNRDVFDSGFPKLADLALNHALTEDFKESLRGFKCERDKAGAETGGKDQSSIHLELVQKGFALAGQLVSAGDTLSWCNVMKIHTFFDQRVYGAEGELHLLCKISLTAVWVFF